MAHQRGDLVLDPTALGSTAVVLSAPTAIGGEHFYLVRLASGEETYLPESELIRQEVDRSSPVSWLTDRPLLDPAGMARSMTVLKATSGLTDILYSLSSSRTLFRVHQFKPVLKVIDSPMHRLLLADEVGLGKTIEAGLVWTELAARTDMRRVLVLCPSGLRQKWRIEMRRRFDRDLNVMDRLGFSEWLDTFAEIGASSRLEAVSSFAQLRSDELIEKVARVAPHFDLVIIDEAHALRNPDTKTHRLGELLAQYSDALLLLSATPVNLGSQDLFNLLRLLQPDEFTDAETFRYQLEPNAHINAAAARLRQQFPPDLEGVAETLRGVESTAQGTAFRRNPVYVELMQRIEGLASPAHADVVDLLSDIQSLNTLGHVYTRTRKRDLKDQGAVRRPLHLAVEFAPAERAAHDAVLALVGALRSQVAGQSGAAALAAVMPARQASSCLPVMRAYLQRMLNQNSIEMDLAEGEEDLDDIGPSSRSAMPSVDEVIRRLADPSAEVWDRLEAADSKFDALIKGIREFHSSGSKKFLVFSFFKMTLGYLHARLTAEGFEVGLMHGGTPMAERESLMDTFRHGSLEILLCSEIGSEGLDFEFCDVVVNYDLPWNPMRLEQRIGRIDRFGQKSPVVHIVNFEMPGTIDTDIFLRLYDRIGVFERSIGELEPIIGDRFQQVTKALASSDLTFEEQAYLADQVAQALVREQSELEQFEKDKERLIGSDAFIEDSLGASYRDKRYITPEELERLVAWFVRSEGAPARLHPPKAAGEPHVLVGSSALADILRRGARRMLRPDLADLILTIEAGGSVAVTFDADVALETKSEFLTIRHPIVAAVLSHYTTDGVPHTAGYVEIPDAGHEGEWIFFLVLLNATGLLPRKSIVVVGVNRETGEVGEDLGDVVLPYLAGDQPRTMKESDIPILMPEEVHAAYDAVLETIALRRGVMSADLSKRNEATVTARQETLRHGLEVRVAQLTTIISDPALDSRILRMRSAQIENLKQRTATEIEKLEAKRAVSVGFTVVAGGLASFRT
ncbi:helicase-related protein [Aquihabitans daechungensis]|uniref:helicase-related protein n=1 Tax=Aquihabitans daechungensis TaxID=1052257 RepID=UPI003B9F563A